MIMNITSFKDEQDLLQYLLHGYIQSADHWWGEYYDETNRWLFSIAVRPYLLIDEPNFVITIDLEKMLERLERRPPDDTIHPLPNMPDEDRFNFAAQFIDQQTDTDLHQQFLEKLNDPIYRQQLCEYSGGIHALLSWVPYEETQYKQLRSVFDKQLFIFCLSALQQTIDRYHLTPATVSHVSFY